MKQAGTLEAYLLEFEKISVMVYYVSMARLVLLFNEGLTKPFIGLMKSHNPSTLKDSMNLTRDLQNVQLPRSKYPPNPNFPSKFKEGKKPWKNDSFSTQNKWVMLCFTCQHPWVLGHKCANGKAHYIEVFSEDDEEGEEEEETQPGYFLRILILYLSIVF